MLIQCKIYFSLFFHCCKPFPVFPDLIIFVSLIVTDVLCLVQLLAENPHAGIQDSGYFLHIENAMLSHEGQYTCVVTNSAGEDKRYFHVSVQGWFFSSKDTYPQVLSKTL